MGAAHEWLYEASERPRPGVYRSAGLLHSYSMNDVRGLSSKLAYSAAASKSRPETVIPRTQEFGETVSPSTGAPCNRRSYNDGHDV